MIPIWKDHIVTLGAAAFVDYEIRLGSIDGSTIFSGRAYRRPGETSCKTRINDICAAHLLNSYPDEDGLRAQAVAGTFVTAILQNNAWTAVDTAEFYNDWSYDYDFTPGALLTDSVGVLHRNQHFLASYLDIDALGSILVIPESGSARTWGLSGDAAFGYAKMPLRDKFPGVALALVEFVGYSWRVADNCAPFVLHYINAYGGWDSVIIIAARRTDTLVRHTNLVDYDNSQRHARGRNDYAIEVSPSWELTTDWLTETQAAVAHHWLNSPFAYLEDLSTNNFIPVLLTGTQTDYKTHRRDGMLNYTFNVQLAQEQFRR